MKLRENDVTWREIDGEMVILDLRTSKYLTANAVGTKLLQLLAADRSTDELADALVDEFDISRDRATGDVEVFVKQLSDRGLLQAAG
ncbi:PqqD family protein [Georgenia subflava]|uniref:PqqD family peptide modification chaperone n=1 Tax=Georgenia subflava TaxID=1622177 RepID=A0A6N7EI94_9MICO|nr:PqqD family protein [Georgenia subflava]MPV38112.1 PqqD family peptide modification chaperone [Georgenia subflava]